MPQYPMVHVDVFAEEKYAGNQLAVFRNAGDLDSEQMLRFTQEMNFSESTFILSDQPRKGGYDVRIFTPAHEMPFAGHPTLGTAFVIQQDIIKEKTDSIVLNLKAGQIPVKPEYKGDTVSKLWMKQLAPEFGATLDPAATANVLQLQEADIDASFPILEVSTGVWFIITPIKTLDAMRRARIHLEKFKELIKGKNADAILLFCPETYHTQNNLNVRVFVHLHGVPEDPATGSANGCLAGYLAKERYFNSDTVDVRVEQGYEIKRPSLLYLRSEKKAKTVDVQVGGKVQIVARGMFV